MTGSNSKWTRAVVNGLMGLALAGAGGCQNTGQAANESSVVNAYADLPAPIANTPYVLTFSDTFDSLASISNGSVFDGSKWYNGVEQCCMVDSAGAPGVLFPTVANGASVYPYALDANGGLDITLSKQNGTWYSGVLTSVDQNQNGFAQQYGYFEMKARVPTGVGTWPAFWMLSTDPTLPGEIDVMESYGKDNGTAYGITLHDWRGGGNTGSIVTPSAFPTVAGMMSDVHSYGVLWTASDLKFYFDGTLVWSHLTPDVMHQPYYLLADLGLGGGWPTTATPTTNVMQITSIRAYQAIPPAVPADVHAQTFGFTGGDQIFAVPAGVTSFTVRAWGAGGGGGDGGYGYAGGGGGYVTGTIAVTSPIYTITVGAGGASAGGARTYGGGGAGHGHSGAGGGRSAVRLGSTELLTAAGGGGSGYSVNEVGGAGGGATGAGGVTAYTGAGATASAGGAGGGGVNGSPGSSGGFLRGGDGAADGGWTGGGGGGYYGGGGGGDTSNHGGAGGGGSSFFGGPNVSAGATIAASAASPGNANDPDWVVGVGVGGAPNGAGGPGRVVITW